MQKLITIKSFTIIKKAESMAGIDGCQFSLDENFIFKDENELETFKEKLAELFCDYYLGEWPTITEEIDNG